MRLPSGGGLRLSGLAGAILAPISGITLIHRHYLYCQGLHRGRRRRRHRASGHHRCGRVLFGTISQLVTFATTPIIGEVALLATAIVLLRLLPQGITGRFFRSGL